MNHELSTEYLAAIETHNAASRLYTAQLASYRGGKIGDAEYLANRSTFDAATSVFDAAYDVESVRIEALDMAAVYVAPDAVQLAFAEAV